MGTAPQRTEADADDTGDSPVMPGEGARWLAHPSRHGTPTASSHNNVGNLQLSDLPAELGADEDARRPPVHEEESPVGLGIGIAGPKPPRRTFASGSTGRTDMAEAPPGHSSTGAPNSANPSSSSSAASSGAVSYSPIILPPPPPSHSTVFPTGDSPTARPRSLTLEQRLSGFDTRPPLLALGLNPARPDAGAATVQASWVRQQQQGQGAQGVRGLKTRGDTDLDALKPSPSLTSSPSSRTAFPTTTDDPFSFRSSAQGASPSRNTASPKSSQPRAVTPTNRPSGSLTAPSSATRSVSSTTSSTRSGPPTLASIAHTSPASTRSSSNTNSSHPLSKPSPHALLAAALFADAPKQPKTSKAEKRGSLFGFPIGAKKKPAKKDQFDETDSSRSSGGAPAVVSAARIESPTSMFRRMGEEEDAADAAKLALESQTSSPSSIFRRLGEGSPPAPSATKAAPGGLFRKFDNDDDDEPAPAKGGPPSPASAFRRLMEESSPTQPSAPSGVFRRVTDADAPAEPSPVSTPSPASIFRRMGWDASPPLTTAPAKAAVSKPTPAPITPAPVTATPAPFKRTNSVHSVPAPAASANGFQYGGDDTPPMPSPAASTFRSMGDDGPAATIAASPAASSFRRMGESPAPGALAQNSPVRAFPSPSIAFQRIADEIAAATPAATPSPAVRGLRRIDDSGYSPVPAKSPASVFARNGNSASPDPSVVSATPSVSAFRRAGDSPQATPPTAGLPKFVEPAVSLVPAAAAEVRPAEAAAPPSPASAFQKLMEESSPGLASSPAGMFRKFNDDAEVETEPPAREPSPASAFRRMMEEGSPDPSAGSPAPAASAFRKMGDDASPALTAGSPSSVFRRFGQETSSPVVLASSPASAFRRMGDAESPVPDVHTPRSAFGRLGDDGQSYRSSPASATAFRRVNDDSPALAPSPVLGHASAASSFRRVESPAASPAGSPASAFGRLGQGSPASQSSASVFERMAELEQEEDDEIDHDDPFWSAMQAPAREVRNVGMLARVQQEPFAVEASPRNYSPGYEINGRPASRSVSSVGSGVSQSRSLASGLSQPKPAATAKSIKSVKSVKEVYAGLPPFPAPRSDLFLKQLTGEDLHKYESVASTFKRSKPAWQTRYLILTSYPTPEHSTAPLLANLHTFKSSFATEKEMTRLELTKWSIVCVPEDNFGRLYALKVTGIVPAERDAKGRIARSHQSKEDSWLIGMDSVESLKLWMEQLKGIVEELNAAPAAATTPPTEMRRTGSDGASIHSHSSGVRTPDLYQTRTPASPQHSSPSRPTKSPRRPPLPEGSSRLSQYSSTDFSHEYEDESATPSTTFSSKFDEQHDDDDEDPETFHPYRRSAHHSVVDTPPRLAVPASGINGFARRGSVDDSSAPRIGSGYRQPQDLIRRDSDMSSLGSMSSSHNLPRGQPPSGAVPTTPPLGHAHEHASPHSRSPSMRTVGSNSERTPNYSKRMSVASNGSAGSGGAAQPRMRQPPMPALPAPSGALPPPPMRPPMGALPPPPMNAPLGALPPPPPHFHPFAAPPAMRPPPMGAIPPPPMGLPLPPPPLGSLSTSPHVQHQPMGLRTYNERD